MTKKFADHVGIARRIVDFFKENKGVGNTAAILDGARRMQANVLVVAEDDKGFKAVKARKQISFAEVEAGQLEGALVVGFPLVMDNAAVVALLKGLLGQIERQRETISDLNVKVGEVSKKGKEKPAK